jgi:hypothetical protein
MPGVFILLKLLINKQMKVLQKKWYWSKAFIINKYSLVLYFLIIFSHFVKAQVNLIPNPSFEDTIGLSISLNGQSSIKNWHNLDSSKINVCAFGYFHINTPQNYIPYYGGGAYQYARHGYGVIGMITYNNVPYLPVPSTVRSTAKVRLHKQLIANKKYCAKANVSYMEATDNITNGFGLYFDNGQLDTIVAKDSSGMYSFITPQVPCPFVISDTSANWASFSGTFIATGVENFLTMANYITDSSLNRTDLCPSCWAKCLCSQILVDDVSLIPTDIANWLPNASVTLGDSVYIGLDKYQVPDAIWYTYNMQVIDTASGIWVKPTQAVTQYIQAIDVCDKIAFDTVTVYANPLSYNDLSNSYFQLNVFPNPATASVTVAINKLLSNNTSIQIMDATGRVVYSILPTDNNTIINTSGFAKGVYVVRYGGGNVKLIVSGEL